MIFALNDAWYAARGIRARPAFAAVVIATLTLGIGVTTAIFSVVHGILLRPLPYAEPERLIHIEHVDPYYKVSEPEFADYRRARTLQRVAAVTMESANLTDGTAEPERITGSRVSDGFFQMLGIAPLLGRTFTADEDLPGAPPVVVLSHGLWQRRYGRDMHIVGKSVVINGVPQAVVGVMPPRFGYPSPDVAAWIPLRLRYDNLWARNNHYLTLVARLAPGASFAGAVRELNRMAGWWRRKLPETYPADQPLSVKARRLADAMLGSTRPYLYALFSAAVFVQLIVCANVASLYLASGESRRRELAIRAALGASRARLVRQSLVEGSLYALVGGTLGLLVAWQGTRLLVALAPPSIPRLDEVRVDGAVLLFGLALSIATGLVVGLLPALRPAGTNAAETLREAGRAGRQGRGMARVHRALVIAEVSLAVVVLVAAGLMLRSTWKLQSVALGFRTANVLTMRVGLPPGQYEGDRAVLLYRSVLDRVRAVAGVRAAGAVADLPVADGWSVWSILVDGAPMTSVGATPSAVREQVTPGYFEALGIPLVQGRAFTEADRALARPVVLVNQTMAKKLWPHRTAIGGTIKVLSPTAPWATVVGVVRDVRQGGFLSGPVPTVFFPHAQAGVSAYYTPVDMTLVIQTAGDPLALTGSVRAIVRQLEPAASLARIQSMQQIVATSVASRRFSAQLLAGFAALALVLAGIGIYGVISYGVTQRRSEMGLRLALGAPRLRVLGLVLGEALWLCAVGLAIGTAAALALTGLARAIVPGLASRDPVTVVAVAITIVCLAILASWVPARRAMLVAPIESLRAE